jgi:hypothetical protein
MPDFQWFVRLQSHHFGTGVLDRGGAELQTPAALRHPAANYFAGHFVGVSVRIQTELKSNSF